MKISSLIKVRLLLNFETSNVSKWKKKIPKVSGISRIYHYHFKIVPMKIYTKNSLSNNAYKGQVHVEPMTNLW
jgi:hypothetical protein